MIPPFDTVITVPNQVIDVPELRQKRMRYKRLAQYVSFDVNQSQAIISMQPVNVPHHGHYRRLMIAKAFVISKMLAKLITVQGASNGISEDQ